MMDITPHKSQYTNNEKKWLNDMSDIITKEIDKEILGKLMIEVIRDIRRSKINSIINSKHVK